MACARGGDYCGGARLCVRAGKKYERHRASGGGDFLRNSFRPGRRTRIGARAANQTETAPGTGKEGRPPALPAVLEQQPNSKAAPSIMARLGQEVSACNPIIHTLCGHVQKAVANTEDLAINTMHRLNKVDSTVTRMTSNLQKTSREKFLPLIEETEKSLKSNKTTLLAFLAHTSDAAKEGENRLTSIAERVHSLESTLQSMRKLAKHTSMLAVDASGSCRRMAAIAVVLPLSLPK